MFYFWSQIEISPYVRQLSTNTFTYLTPSASVDQNCEQTKQGFQLQENECIFGCKTDVIIFLVNPVYPNWPCL